MSKIQAAFNGSGRKLFESERPTIDAFNAKYRAALTEPQSGKLTESPPAKRFLRRGVIAKLTPEGMVIVEAKPTGRLALTRARKTFKSVKTLKKPGLHKTKSP